MLNAVWQSAAAFLWSAGAFAVAIAVLVAIHEFGHFWVARKLGVKVLRFSIGFGKALWRRSDSQGCEYVIAAIPLGGYVKMLDEREGPVSDSEVHLSFGRQAVWKRCLIVLAGPAANFLLAICLYWGMFSGGQQALAPVIGMVTSASPAAVAGLQEGQEIVAVDGAPTATRAAVMDALLARLGDTGTLAITVRFPGNTTSYEMLIDLKHWLSNTEMPDPLAQLGFDFYWPPYVLISDVLPDSRAAAAGLKSGDVIEKLDGKPVSGVAAWLTEVRSRAEQPLVLGIRRQGVLQDFTVKPARELDEHGQAVGRIGAQIAPPPIGEQYIREIHYSPVQALWKGIQETASQSQLLLMALKKLLVGDISPKNLSGPLGIAKVAGDSAGHGLAAFCRMLAILSINLGVVNLLPIPVLDGGLFLLYLIEAVKGSPVPEKIQLVGSQIGMTIIAGLMLFAIYNDLLRL